MLAALLIAMQATPQGAAARDARELAEALTGAWNNTEAVYFADELSQPPIPRGSLDIEDDGAGGLVVRIQSDEGGRPRQATLSISAADGALGAVLSADALAPCEFAVARLGDTFTLSPRQGACTALGDGGSDRRIHVSGDLLVWPGIGEARRADPYTCWVSLKTDEGGWTWTPDLTIEEGGYVQLPEEPGVTRPAGLKLRHVRWPYGRNRDSLVLYVHEAEDEAAVSYVWTEPDAERIAVNLRWIQASCTRSAE